MAYLLYGGRIAEQNSGVVEMELVHQQIKTCITETKAIIVVGSGVSIAVTGGTDAS